MKNSLPLGAGCIRLLLTLCCTLIASFAITTDANASSSPCFTERVAEQSFSVCRFDMASVAIEVMHRAADGQPLASLINAARVIRRRKRAALLLTNGGMYHEDLAPVGYHVEHKRKLKNANTRRGPGNFHMLPNGIFYVERGRAGVMETRAFLKRNRRPEFATQSGPMLVVDNRIHPRFDPDSKSRKSRNGVGVSADGKTVYFAITDAPATFHAFARLFKDRLKTPNALFLDGGSVPQMWAKDGVNRISFAPVGPVIAVIEKSRASSAKRTAR
jgi:uncharacterized protein YigE (DUF2233 family)